MDADHAGNRVTRREPIIWYSKRQNTVETSTFGSEFVTLKKKHNAIAYHRAREAVAAGMIRVTKEDGKTNLADVLTKPLPQITREYLCDKFMY